MLDDELLGPNGYLRKLEEDPDNDGYFKAVPVVNYASKAVESWIKSNGEKAEPGTTVRVDYSRPSEEDWR